MAFPFELDAEEDGYTDELETLTEYEINFETGELTGKKVTGLEAIKTWVYFALRIQRYHNLIYSWDFGNELEDLIGKSYSFEYLETELPRMITECLLINPNISEVNNYKVTLKNDNLTIDFTIITVYGNEVISLNV